jgi:acetoin:2,6-dichlorophenolindophenol oxidoreductase subunit alpha
MELTREQQVEVLRRMWLIRYFEETAIRLYGEGRYKGSTHPYIAQEATALGVCAALRPTDKVLATYRGHGVAIAKGASPKAMMAELLGKASGLDKGKGGSMHMSQSDIGFVGSNAIVSGHIAIGGGLALADQLDGKDAVTVVFLGDGASCEGVFYETLNMAALWKLPLVLVVENNGLAISTPVETAISVPSIAMRAQGFGLPGVSVNGCDFYTVYEAAGEAAARARRGAGPTLLEAKTVRWGRHSAVARSSNADHNKWRETDPLPRFRAELLERGLLGQADAEQIREAAEAEIKAAEEFALESPYPSVDDLYSDMFA